MESRAFRTTRRLQNLQSSRPDWYRIENKASGPTQITIFDEIGMLGTSADNFVRDLSSVNGDIELHLNSPGGDIFDGIAIYNSLKQRKGTVSVVVDGLAASAASFISQAASPGQLKMAPHSQMMLHNGFGMVIGDANDLRKTADLLDKATQNIASIYAERTGKPTDHWRGVMNSETWYDDAEAVAEGLADGILGQEAPSNAWDLSVYAKAVQDLKNEKYNTDDRKRMASSGEAMENGSYPIADEEDLHNAIHAVGRGGSDHDAIRKHIIKRAAALGASDAIPDNWNSDGSLQEGASNKISPKLIRRALKEAFSE